MKPTLKAKYADIQPSLMGELSVSNVNAAPKLVKIVVNAGLGARLGLDKEIDALAEELALITGQKPVPTVAKKAVAGFKVRQGQVVGLKVTLRGDKMYEFLERLISIALPRTRDFRGLPRNTFSGGSYAIGIKEHNVFPEIAAKGVVPTPIGVIIVTSSNNSVGALKLLEALGMPIKKEEVKSASGGKGAV